MSSLNSVNGIVEKSPTTPLVRIPPWKVLVPSTVADGSAVANIEGATFSSAVGATTFAANAKCITAGGRMVLGGASGGRLEILPLHTSNSGPPTVALQLFAFDYHTDEEVTGVANVGRQYFLANNNKIALGIPYNLCRDLSSAPATVTLTQPASAETVVRLFNGRTPYRATSGGTTYYLGERLVMDISGMTAVLPYITAISAGSVVLLGRVV